MQKGTRGALPGEVVVDYRSPGGPVVKSVRGVLLLSYVERLKAYGHYDRYLAAIPEAPRERLLYTTAMSWVPVELAMFHFAACDGLALTEDELQEHGSKTAGSMGPAMLGTLLRAVGTTPLTALTALGRVWDRIHEGGSCYAVQTGPKDLHLEQRGNPMVSSRFYRISGQGFYRALAEFFCKRAYVKSARPELVDPLSYAVEISWA
jgi:hypothetical protein